MSHAALNRRTAFIYGASACCSLLIGRSASAGLHPPVTVELFTSQGCSSCPPADRFMRELARQPGVLAISYNVDYWDYLGWRDTLASPAFSQRQYDYAKQRGDGEVYTPQMVVNGRAHAVGSDTEGVLALIERERRRTAAPMVTMAMRDVGEEMHLEIEGSSGQEAAQDATVWLLQVSPKISVTIARGENAGQTMDYVNVVRKMMPVGMWQGNAMDVKLPLADLVAGETPGCVSLLQVGGVGPILSSTQYGLSA